MSPTWETTADFDAAQSETGVHHEQPSATDWAASDTIEKGYPSVLSWVTPSLLGYYPMAESSGSTLNDVAASNDGTYNNSPSLGQTSGPFGKNYVDFTNANSEYADTGKTFSTTSDELAIAGWYKVDAWDTSYQAVVNCFDQSGPHAYGLDRDSSNDFLRFIQNDSSGYVKVTSSVAHGADSTWHFFALGQDGGSAYLQVDGTTDTTNNTVSDGTSGNTYQIGSSGRGTAYWTGGIAHIMFFDGPLDSTDRDALRDAAL